MRSPRTASARSENSAAAGPSAGAGHLLEGVQHEQDPARAQVRLDQAGHRVAGRVHPEPAGHQGGDQPGIAGLRERNEAHPIGIVAAQRGRRRDGQPGLPDAAHPGEGEQPHLRVAQPGHDGGEFLLAPDQPGRWHRRHGSRLPAAPGRLGRAGAAAPRGRLEAVPLVAGQAQPYRDTRGGLAVHAVTQPALDIADGAGADTRPLGQLLLCQACGVTMAAQQATQGGVLHRLHPPGQDRNHPPQPAPWPVPQRRWATQ